MDLPLLRFRQIIAAIRRRQMMERRQAIALASWQTRQITTFTAAGFMVEKDKPNEALEIAQMLAFDEIEKAQLEESRVEHMADNVAEVVNGIAFDAEGNIVPEIPMNLPSAMDVGSVFGDPSHWERR